MIDMFTWQSCNLISFCILH